MFGMKHHDSHCEERWAARRAWRSRYGHGHGEWGGRGGMGGGDMLRAGRMLAQGDLRLIALALIAEQPRHGYEIIKLLEEKTAGWYAPSPGIVYPTLTYLEEAGYVTAQAEGSKKLYAITDDGRAYLADNRDFVDAVLRRFEAIGEKVERWRQRQSDDTDEQDDEHMPRSVRGAFRDLRDAVRTKLRDDPSAKLRVIEAIDRIIAEIKTSSGEGNA